MLSSRFLLARWIDRALDVEKCEFQACTVHSHVVTLTMFKTITVTCVILGLTY